MSRLAWGILGTGRIAGRLADALATLVMQAGGRTEVLSTETEGDRYRFEIDTVAEHLARRASPLMSPEDTLGNMDTLDAWRREAGVRYACDESEMGTDHAQ